jgi:hypothetical protein
MTPALGEPVVHKSACDSFFETPLAAELESRKIGKLIIAGCMTQYCVDTSVRRAVSLGYDVMLMADGHMTADSGGLSGLIKSSPTTTRCLTASMQGTIRCAWHRSIRFFCE